MSRDRDDWLGLGLSNQLMGSQGYQQSMMNQANAANQLRNMQLNTAYQNSAYNNLRAATSSKMVPAWRRKCAYCGTQADTRRCENCGASA